MYSEKKIVRGFVIFAVIITVVSLFAIFKLTFCEKDESACPRKISQEVPSELQQADGKIRSKFPQFIPTADWKYLSEENSWERAYQRIFNGGENDYFNDIDTIYVKVCEDGQIIVRDDDYLIRFLLDVGRGQKV